MTGVQPAGPAASAFTERQVSRVAHALAVQLLGPEGLHNTDDDTQRRFRALAAAALGALGEVPRRDARRQMTGALRSTIDAHGPITAELIGSAVDRLHGQLTARINQLEIDLRAARQQ